MPDHHAFYVYEVANNRDIAATVTGVIFGRSVRVDLHHPQWEHVKWRVGGFGPFTDESEWKPHLVDALVELHVVTPPAGYVPFNGQAFDPTDFNHHDPADVAPVDVHPCPECGERGPCGYDDQGRPMVHIVKDGDE